VSNVTNVEISGLRELQIALSMLPLELRGQAMQKALLDGAKPIIEAAIAKAPENEGRLKASIYSRKVRGADVDEIVREVTVRSGWRAAKKGKDAFYWKFIEFGRAAKTAQKGQVFRFYSKFGAPVFTKTIRALPARPFLRPAFEEQKLAALAIIRDSTKIAVVKAAAKVEGRMAVRRRTGVPGERRGQWR
jgi:HK97 gp10 family phage protein